MKNLILVFVFFYLFKPVFPVMDYALNYDYITQELCENRDKPEIACNGKCHLMKELAKYSTDDQDEPKQEKTAKNFTEILFCESITPLDFTPFSVANLSVVDTYQSLYFRLYSTSIPHPPSC